MEYLDPIQQQIHPIFLPHRSKILSSLDFLIKMLTYSSFKKGIHGIRWLKVSDAPDIYVKGCYTYKGKKDITFMILKHYINNSPEL